MSKFSSPKCSPSPWNQLLQEVIESDTAARFKKGLNTFYGQTTPVQSSKLRFEMEPMELPEQARDTWLEALHSFSPVRKKRGEEAKIFYTLPCYYVAYSLFRVYHSPSPKHAAADEYIQTLNLI
ncbi:hypothetical protein HGM15179_011373 [Zosterops borbonicus]|uniref:Uncharacterized protein n=1 Tax=Zosterops borbonicus TaxID=364589 RepID=A0A8K1GBQ9_9PASS|nr:hypothetical protein HGM15179_011373 [Zosterops borbonicus]